MSIAAENSSYPTFPSLTNRATHPVRSRAIVLLSAERRCPKIYEFNPDVLYNPKRRVQTVRQSGTLRGPEEVQPSSYLRVEATINSIRKSLGEQAQFLRGEAFRVTKLD